MKRRTLILSFLVFLFFSPLQTGLLEGIAIFGLKPDLGFVLSCLIGWFGGRRKGLLSGSSLGALHDIFSVGHLGLHCAFNGLIGFGSGFLEETLLIQSALSILLPLIFIASLLHQFIGTLLLHGVGPDLLSVSPSIVWRSLYNLFLAWMILFLFSKCQREGNRGM